MSCFIHSSICLLLLILRVLAILWICFLFLFLSSFLSSLTFNEKFILSFNFYFLFANFIY